MTCCLWANKDIDNRGWCVVCVCVCVCAAKVYTWIWMRNKYTLFSRKAKKVPSALPVSEVHPALVVVVPISCCVLAIHRVTHPIPMYLHLYIYAFSHTRHPASTRLMLDLGFSGIWNEVDSPSRCQGGLYGPNKISFLLLGYVGQVWSAQRGGLHLQQCCKIACSRPQ